MEFFTKKSVIRKVIIAVIIILLFGTIAPNYVNAAVDTGIKIGAEGDRI